MDPEKFLQLSQVSLTAYSRSILKIHEISLKNKAHETQVKYEVDPTNFEPKRLFTSYTGKLGQNAENFIARVLKNDPPIINLKNIAESITSLCKEFEKINDDLSKDPEWEEFIKEARKNPANPNLTSDENIFGSYFFKIISRINKAKSELKTLNGLLKKTHTVYLKVKSVPTTLIQLEHAILDELVKSKTNRIFSEIESALVAPDGSETKKKLPDYQNSLVTFINNFAETTNSFSVSTLFGNEFSEKETTKAFYANTLCQAIGADESRVAEFKKYGLGLIRQALIKQLKTKPSILFKLINSLSASKQLSTFSILLDREFAQVLINAGAIFAIFEKLLRCMSDKQKLSLYKETKETLQIYLATTLIQPSGRRGSTITTPTPPEQVNAAIGLAEAFQAVSGKEDDKDEENFEGLNNLLKQYEQRKPSNTSIFAGVSNDVLMIIVEQLLPFINKLNKQLDVFKIANGITAKIKSTFRNSFIGESLTEADLAMATKKDLIVVNPALKNNLKSFLSAIDIIKSYNEKNKGRRDSNVNLSPSQPQKNFTAAIQELSVLIDNISNFIKPYSTYILEKLEQFETEIAEITEITKNSQLSPPKNDATLLSSLAKKFALFVKNLPSTELFKRLTDFDSKILSFNPDEFHKRLEAAKQNVNKLLNFSKPKSLEVAIPVKQAISPLPSDSPINTKQSQPPVVTGWKTAKATSSPNPPTLFVKK